MKNKTPKAVVKKLAKDIKDILEDRFVGRPAPTKSEVKQTIDNYLEPLKNQQIIGNNAIDYQLDPDIRSMIEKLLEDPSEFLFSEERVIRTLAKEHIDSPLSLTTAETRYMNLCFETGLPVAMIITNIGINEVDYTMELVNNTLDVNINIKEDEK